MASVPSWLKGDDRKQETYVFNSARTVEHDRLETQSTAINVLMRDRPFRARLPDNPRRILEIGCGTGQMTVLLGRKYPNAKVYGVDPAPVPPIHNKPANVEYIQAKFEDLLASNDPRLAAGSFDYIFSRMLTCVVLDWSTFLRQVTSLVAPGGWVEQQELCVYIHYSADSPDSEVPGSEDWQWAKAARDCCKARGVDTFAGRLMPSLLSAAGLKDVENEHFPFVLTPWKKRLETAKLLEFTTAFVPQITKMFIHRFGEGKYTPDELENMDKEIDQVRYSEIEGLHWRWYACIGRKPS